MDVDNAKKVIEEKSFLTDVQLKILKFFEKAEKKHLKEIKIISKAFT